MERRVALFVTCLVDLYRPSVAFSAIKLLETNGCTVEVPEAQTCCGQPAYNAGEKRLAQEVALKTIEAFEGYDYIVAPSGSCAGMIREGYPELFADDPALLLRVERLAHRTWELTSFLTDVLGVTAVPGELARKVTYHDSCSGLRELGVKAQPRALLAAVKGLSLTELEDAETCCGFGGTFCVKYPDISDRMVTNKTDAIIASGADMLLAGDLGCLLNMAGKLKRRGSAIEVRHVAEVLAGELDQPAIGEPTR